MGKSFLAPENHTPYQTFHPSQSQYHAWPGCIYELGGTGQTNPVPHEPLVGRGLPPFFNPRDAITDWIQVPFGDNDGRYGRLLLFIPDFTARLGQITFADAVLNVQASFTPGVLSISVLATDGRTTFRKTEPLKEEQSFELMPNPIPCGSSLRMIRAKPWIRLPKKRRGQHVNGSFSLERDTQRKRWE